LAGGVSGSADARFGWLRDDFRRTKTQFTVDWTPPAAQARTSTGFTCEATDCSFKIPRKESFVITVGKAG
jgi:hypothetical protein